MLIITPRTFFVGGPTGAGRVLGGRGILAEVSSRSTSIVGVGSRPWLQKVAALTVAVSLTIATADTFKVAEKQYNTGFLDATAMRNEVVGGMEIRITRVISDIFLWLAQVQTLIRLFPRHKEKVLIKWIGFALIVLDTVFSCLNSFLVNSTDRPRDFENAIPALSYLFQLALELLYGAWVLFYVATKRRYALYHPKMKNICLVALLSLIAILTPVVFFVTDIAQPDVDGWGDYFRWVGAAAASVLVWEWVERIEALEREEKKDGILGREVFDGDEMLDVTPAAEVNWPGQTRGFGGDDSSGQNSKQSTIYTTGLRGHGLTNIAQRIVPSRLRLTHTQPGRSEHPPSHASDRPLMLLEQVHPDEVRRPTAVASPISSADTTSRASTIYAVHYNPIAPPSPLGHQNTAHAKGTSKTRGESANDKGDARDSVPEKNYSREMGTAALRKGTSLRWQALVNQFKRKRDTPPPEVRLAMANSNPDAALVETKGDPSRWHVMSRLASLAADSTERWRDRAGGRQTDIELPVTIIPAQPRGRTWSPGTLQLNESRNESNSKLSASPRSQEVRDAHTRSQGALSSQTRSDAGWGNLENPSWVTEEATQVRVAYTSPLAPSTATENNIVGRANGEEDRPNNTPAGPMGSVGHDAANSRR